jgi:hypothetical protein
MSAPHRRDPETHLKTYTDRPLMNCCATSFVAAATRRRQPTYWPRPT